MGASDLAQFDYALPPDRIAQEPAEPRDSARLLVLDRQSGEMRDTRVAELGRCLRAGDCLVVNDTRVVPARLLGRVAGSEHDAEVLLLHPVGPTGEDWAALLRPARRCPVGTAVVLADGIARATVTAREPLGRARIRLEAPVPVEALLDAHGLPPLPPYIRRYRKPGGEDWARYQTVYAARPGAVAAPTAGLHFTPELLAALEAHGIELRRVTLHVGPGTFRPVRAERVAEHRMEAERFEVTEATAAALTRARREGRRVVAVGTTTVRTLEAVARPDGSLVPGTGWTDLTIVPGHRFRAVDALLTNFHLPRSSLLLLVSAFAGRERVLRAYAHAVAAGYRFYSYGDAMLIADGVGF
ncbi:MAG TPA: tRNA preQ1(34) S-adenosylmethionine ribosyltransferase-isomerase QueA [Methylomirabilota bacterium]